MYRDNFIATIKCRGDVLREFNSGIIKLPFGADYSIVLKNKSKRRALVDVRIDGKDVMNGNKLIACYDTPIELKGYMDGRVVKNSFRFVEKTAKIDKFRGNNIEDGIVEVKFSFEKEPLNYMFNGGWGDYTNTLKYSSDVRDIVSCVTDAYSCTSSCSAEGITVKGKPTSQNFDVGSFGNTDGVEYNIVFKLQGSSGKKIKTPVTVKTKIQCNTCGQKCKATDNYCSNCSTYIQ